MHVCMCTYVYVIYMCRVALQYRTAPLPEPLAKDLVECLLSEDGSGYVLWRINGGKALERECSEISGASERNCPPLHGFDLAIKAF